jgi:hypothetical protein
MSDNTLLNPNPSFWDKVEEAEKISGADHTFIQIEIAFGWKVFVSTADGVVDENGDPISQGASFFPYSIGDKASIEAAKKKASKFIIANGLDKNPSNVFMMRLIRDTCLNKELKWKDDRFFFFFPKSGPSKDPMRKHASWFYEEYISKKLRENGVQSLGFHWAEISWARDEGGKFSDKKDADGSLVVDEEGEVIQEQPLNAYPVRIFATKADALEACGKGDVEEEVEEAPVKKQLPPMPDGYDEESWSSTVADIKSESKKGAKTPKIASDYGLDIKTVKAIIES